MDGIGVNVLNVVIGVISAIVNFVLSIICLIGDMVVTTFDFLSDPGEFISIANAIQIGNLNIVAFCQNCFIPLGIALATIIFFLSLYQTALSPVISGGEKVGKPITIVGRFMTTVIVVVASSRLCDLIFFLANQALSGLQQMANYALRTVSVSGSWSLTESFNDANGFSLADLAETTGAQAALAEATRLPESIITAASGLAQLLLVGFLMVVIAWNLFQFYLEMFERYAVLIGITSIAPLTLATSVSPSTEKVAKSWFSFFIGQTVLWVSQYFSLVVIKIVLGSLSPLQSAFSDGTQGLFIWAGMSYAFINFARHADDYINKLGLTAARTGEGLFKDLGSLVAAGKMVKSVAKVPGAVGSAGKDLAGKTVLGAAQTRGFIKKSYSSGADYASKHGANTGIGKVAGGLAGVATTSATAAISRPAEKVKESVKSSFDKGSSSAKNAFDEKTQKNLDRYNLQSDGSYKKTSTEGNYADGLDNMVNDKTAKQIGMKEKQEGTTRTYSSTSYDTKFAETKDRGKEILTATDKDDNGNVVGYQSKTYKPSDDANAKPQILDEEQFKFGSTEFEKAQKIAGSNEVVPSKTTTKFESDNQDYEAITTKNADSTNNDDKYNTMIYSVDSDGQKHEVSSFNGKTNNGVEVAQDAHNKLHESNSSNHSEKKEAKAVSNQNQVEHEPVSVGSQQSDGPQQDESSQPTEKLQPAEEGIVVPQQVEVQPQSVAPQKESRQQQVSEPQRESRQQQVSEPQRESRQQQVSEPQRESRQQQVSEPQRESRQQQVSEPQRESRQRQASDHQQASRPQHAPEPQRESRQQRESRPQQQTSRPQSSRPQQPSRQQQASSRVQQSSRAQQNNQTETHDGSRHTPREIK